jgi:tetratricopeptide (TPR) repeat protein
MTGLPILLPLAIFLLIIAKWGFIHYGRTQLRKLKTIQASLAAYRTADYPSALMILEDLKDDRLAYCQLRGDLLAEMGNLEEAEKCLREAVALVAANPGDSPPKTSSSPSYEVQTAASAWTSLGVVLAKQGKNDEAMNCFRMSLNFWPNRGESCREIAIALLEQESSTGDLSWARQAVDEDRASKPLSAEAYATNLGESLAVLARAVASESRSRDEVDRLIDDALSTTGTGVKPSAAEVHYQAGMAYATLGDEDRSESHLSQAAQLAPLAFGRKR